MEQPYVKHSIENYICYITFFHPAHNALPSDLLSKLETVIKSASEDKDVRVIVLESGGDRTFCAGASFNELIHIENKTEGASFFTGFAKVINAMRTCPKFIICKVQGKAVGGGVGIAAASDYCLATKYGSIKLSELSIGIGPFVIEPAVTRKIGIAAMSELAINAETFYDASWAHRKGLYAYVGETAQELDDQTQVLANKLSTYSPKAMEAMKAVMWQGTDHWEVLLNERAAISGELVLSDFTKNVLQAYK